MNTGRYKSYKKSDVVNQEPGYIKAWLSLKSDFATLQKPTLSTPTPLIGEAYTIGTAHAWTVGKEAMSIYVKRDTLDAPGESQGEMQNQRIIYSPKIFIIGDGPVGLEIVNNILNEDLILFVQEDCGTKFIQFGNEEAPALVSKASFNSGQLKSGAKGYEVTLDAICKYFYTGTITERS